VTKTTERERIVSGRSGNRTVMRTPLLVVLSLVASGCVHVNMPDHLVSDTVDAGKDAVRTIARTFDAKPKYGVVESNSKRTSFWLAQQGSAEQSVAQLQQSCVDTLVAETHALAYWVREQKIEASAEGLVVRCRIDITPATAAR